MERDCYSGFDLFVICDLFRDRYGVLWRGRGSMNIVNNGIPNSQEKNITAASIC